MPVIQCVALLAREKNCYWSLWFPKDFDFLGHIKILLQHWDTFSLRKWNIIIIFEESWYLFDERLHQSDKSL